MVIHWQLVFVKFVKVDSILAHAIVKRNEERFDEQWNLDFAKMGLMLSEDGTYSIEDMDFN